MPALIILYMAVVAVVFAVAHSPAMVRHKNGGMSDVAYQVIQITAATETLVATVKTG